jgi:hypothetical protein
MVSAGFEEDVEAEGGVVGDPECVSAQVLPFYLFFLALL